MTGRARAPAGLLLALLLGGCGEAAPLNLILISIDTLRADRLGSYGYGRDTTPHIDRLAADAVLFRNAVAESPWTLPSHYTMLTGLYPSTHGGIDPELRPGADRRFLAERMAARGYRTLAFTDGNWLSEERFGRGFGEFRGVRRQGFAAKLPEVQARLAELPARPPFFLFLHSYELHCPYAPPEPYYSLFRSEGSIALATRGRCGNPHFNELSLAPGEALFLSDVYDGSLRAADAALGGFFRFLADAGLLERSVVVLTSDHGEEFLEHGRIGHEGSVYRELLAVPLVIRAPGFAPRSVDTPVGLVDLVPTLLALLGLQPVVAGGDASDGAALEGRSLVPLMRGGTDPDFPAHRFAELGWKGNLDSWLGPEAQLIVDRDTGSARFFALDDDPLEQRDLARERPAEVAALRAEVDRFSSRLRRRPALPERRAVTPKERERLEGLGYVLEP